MVFRALSEFVKHTNNQCTDNAILQQAVNDYTQELAKPDGMKRKGACTIAEEHGIPEKYRTIINHATGRTKPMSAFNASKQKLLLVRTASGGAARGTLR